MSVRFLRCKITKRIHSVLYQPSSLRWEGQHPGSLHGGDNSNQWGNPQKGRWISEGSALLVSKALGSTRPKQGAGLLHLSVPSTWHKAVWWMHWIFFFCRCICFCFHFADAFFKLRWNSLNIKLTVLNCTIQCHLYIHSVVQPPPLSSSKCFHHPKRKPHSH